MNIQNGENRGMNWYPACYQFWQASSSFHFLAWRSERVRILWDIHPLTSASSVPLSVLLSVLPFLFLSLPPPPTHLYDSLSSAWPGLRCLPPSCIPLALRSAWACLEHRERQYYTAAHTHKITADVSKTYRCHICRASAVTIYNSTF